MSHHGSSSHVTDHDRTFASVAGIGQALEHLYVVFDGMVSGWEGFEVCFREKLFVKREWLRVTMKLMVNYG